jgi:hypothetical protein
MADTIFRKYEDVLSDYDKKVCEKISKMIVSDDHDVNDSVILSKIIDQIIKKYDIDTKNFDALF